MDVRQVRAGALGRRLGRLRRSSGGRCGLGWRRFGGIRRWTPEMGAQVRLRRRQRTPSLDPSFHNPPDRTLFFKVRMALAALNVITVWVILRLLHIDFVCFCRHLYSSMEHLTTLLSSSDLDVVLAVLNLLYMFSKRSQFISRLAVDKRQALLSRYSFSLHTITYNFGNSGCPKYVGSSITC